MSVITSHHISSKKDNLFDRLVDAGVIHEGEIYSPRRKEMMQFEHVFDYTKCDAETRKEIEEINKKNMEHYAKSLADGFPEKMTKEEQEEKIKDVEKCDYHLMPVYSYKGSVGWNLNYGEDTMPAVAISRMFPKETFDYLQTTEGRLDVDCMIKNGNPIYNEKIFVNPKNFSYIRDENKKATGISISGYQHTDGKYYNVELPFFKDKEVNISILGKNVQNKNLVGYAVVSIRPNAEVSLVSKEGKEKTNVKSVKKFINAKNRKVTNKKQKDMGRDDL